MTEAAPWSLSRRLTSWLSICVAGLLVAESALVVWFVRDTLRRELDGLAEEESAELRADLLQEDVDQEQLQRLIEHYDEEHPEALLSLRVWREPFETPWMSAGAQPALPWSELPMPADGQTLAPERLLRVVGATSTVHMLSSSGLPSEENLRSVLLIDGSPRARQLERTASLFLLISLAGAVGLVLVGLVFVRKLTRLLERVAESASVARLEDERGFVAPEQAPLEIRTVTDAFRESIEGMRAVHSRNVLLTAGLAHELRSPLQNLITEAEVGLLSDRDGVEYRRLISAQLEELRSLALVVDNLITLTALRDHGELPRGESFDLAAEARLRLSHEEQDAARRDVRITIHDRGDCSLIGDREAIVLMLRNLVGNAVRWTRADSSVEVHLEGSPDSVTITVDDQGPGVPAQEREAIFEPFYQGSAPRGTRVGYGLGLALARTAARSAGGDIDVSDSATGGARFLVRLPRQSRTPLPRSSDDRAADT